jgi:hypothetical protein
MDMNFPLYPSLSEEAEKEAVAYLEGFKAKMLKLIEETLGEVYANLIPYIQSDAWGNFRNELLDGLRNYDNRKVQAEYDFARIRRAIYEEYRDEIIADLDQDNLAEIEKLKRTIEKLREYERQWGRR